MRAAYGEMAASVDVIHDHTDLGPLHAIAADVRVPVVTTLHGPIRPARAGYHELLSARVGVISHQQVSVAPSVAVAAVIHHGVDVDRFPLGDGAGAMWVFLGPISPDKGAHRAVEIG